MPRAAVVPKPATVASGLRTSSPGDNGGAFAATQQLAQRAAFEQAQGGAALEALRRQLGSCPFLSGRQLPAQTIAAADTKKMQHGLGRVPSGWWLIDVTGDPRIYRAAWDASTITLGNAGAAAATCVVWVF